MRKTEHVHALLQVLGFRNPRQYFLSGDFVHLFRQVWSYVASVSFTSQEACATHLSPSRGLHILRGEPLMPVLPGQASKIGNVVAQEYEQFQREARGLRAVPAATSSTKPVVAASSVFSSWTPQAYGDRSLSSDAWARYAVRDCNHGSILNANHVLVSVLFRSSASAAARLQISFARTTFPWACASSTF